MAQIKYSAHSGESENENCDVFQMRAIKGGLALGFSIAEDTPAALYELDVGTDVTFLRRSFPGFPYFKNDATNEEIGREIGKVITAALDHRRKND
jgi:hypothetical protein